MSGGGGGMKDIQNKHVPTTLNYVPKKPELET